MSYVTTDVEKKAAIDQLQKALQADDADEKDFHVREAIQLLQLADRPVSTDAGSTNELVE